MSGGGAQGLVIDPIHVDFLPQATFALPGRLGLTIAPGMKDWVTQRNLEADMVRLHDAFGADVIVSFLEDSELEFLGIRDHESVARAHGMRVHRLPVVDGGVPEHTDAVLQLVRAVIAMLADGETVILHCRAGLGRSGLFAACCLVGVGHEPAEAIRIIQAARKGAVETSAQGGYVGHFAHAWHASIGLLFDE